MTYVTQGDVVLEQTQVRQHTVRTYIAHVENLHVTRDGNTYTVEVRRPDLATTEWDGSLHDTIDRDVTVSVDDNEVATIPVQSGTGQFDLTITEPGTHTITVVSPLALPATLTIEVAP